MKRGRPLAGRRGVSKNYEVLLAYGDLHFNKEDPGLVSILRNIITDLQPDIILDGGDLVDGASISEYRKKPVDLASLQQEINRAIAWQRTLKVLVPNARCIMLDDNHFWERLKRKKMDEPWAEGLECLSGETLLAVEQTGWEATDVFVWKNRVMFLHGDDRKGSVECPSNLVRKMVGKTGMTLVRFHTHVTGFEVHNLYQRECLGIQLGSFESPRSAGYLRYTNIHNWSTSAGIFYLSRTDDSFLFVPIIVIDRHAAVNGMIYYATDQ